MVYLVYCFFAFKLRIYSFGLIGLWTIRLSAGSRSCAEDMTITNVIIKIPDRKWLWGVDNVMLGSEGLRFLVIFEKAVCWDLNLGRASSPGELTVGDVGTVSIVKIVSLSPRVERLKVKKCLNNENRQSFGFLCIYILHIIMLVLCYIASLLIWRKFIQKCASKILQEI